jgi:hypothetical protein
MSRLDELLLFKIADITDIEIIMQFIKECWNSDHILANNRDFFEYEYGNGDKLNFLLAINKSSGRLEAVYAFYLYSDTNNGSSVDVAGGMSRVRDDCKIPMVGTYMYKYLLSLYNVRCMLGVGVKRDTAYEINRKLFKYCMGKLTQYYMLSEDVYDYKIAHIENKIIKDTQGNNEELVQYNDSNELFKRFIPERYKSRITYKDKDYIIHRYFNHPIYKYQFYLLKDSLLLICREVCAFNGKIMRIIDCLGDVAELRNVGHGLKGIIKNQNYEYIDLMAYGIEDEVMFSAGFSKVEDDDVNIIPNYFEPFVRQNIDIYCTASVENTIIFKGDADQDRPSRI